MCTLSEQQLLFLYSSLSTNWYFSSCFFSESLLPVWFSWQPRIWSIYIGILEVTVSVIPCFLFHTLTFKFVVPAPNYFHFHFRITWLFISFYVSMHLVKNTENFSQCNSIFQIIYIRPYWPREPLMFNKVFRENL